MIKKIKSYLPWIRFVKEEGKTRRAFTDYIIRVGKVRPLKKGENNDNR